MPPLLPTAFLPPLPRNQFTLDPLRTPDLLAHISVLKGLYVPPIHGGFTVEEVTTTDAAIAGCSRGAGRDGPRTSLGLDRLTLDGVDEEPENNYYVDDDDDDDDDGQAERAHLDAFEKEWSEKWLNGVVRRAQAAIESGERVGEMEGLLREATAVLAMMAGTSAAGSLTRHLLFPVAPYLAAAASAPSIPISADLSPETTTFLRSLQQSPELGAVQLGTSPNAQSLTSPSARVRAPTSPSAGTSASPVVTATSPSRTRARRASSSASVPPLSPRHRRRPAAVPVLLHDAPMGDHLGVGMQTWGSAILLGREMALRPADFGLVGRPARQSSAAAHAPDAGPRVLELGAGTGLLSILCRKLLDLHAATQAHAGAAALTPYGHVLATDFLPNVLANLQTCVDLNFALGGAGIDVAKLDWTTFVPYMETHAGSATAGHAEGEAEEVARYAEGGWDLVLASDCVYDDTHAELLRKVGGWVLRLPDPVVSGDVGGTFHILSPLRPTFAPELESIDTYFPTLASYAPLADRQAFAQAFPSAAGPDAEHLRGEGFGRARGLKLGVRGQGKRSVQGRKGEGRVDEVVGYWWWEVGWG
ncbi:hypothetical protein Q5752_001159 [Cryptotrichosporon argae]